VFNVQLHVMPTVNVLGTMSHKLQQLITPPPVNAAFTSLVVVVTALQGKSATPKTYFLNWIITLMALQNAIGVKVAQLHNSKALGFQTLVNTTL
jgi:hypothetical protein